MGRADSGYGRGAACTFIEQIQRDVLSRTKVKRASPAKR
jgi:hypothetical protein